MSVLLPEDGCAGRVGVDRHVPEPWVLRRRGPPQAGVFSCVSRSHAVRDVATPPAAARPRPVTWSVDTLKAMEQPQHPDMTAPYLGPAAPGPQPYPPPPGMVVPGGYPYPVPPRTGTVAWSLGFLTFIPYVGMLVAPITVIAVGLGQRKHGSVVATANGCNAANWAITHLLLQALGVALCAATVFAAESEPTKSLPPLGIVSILSALAVFIVALVAHLVVTIQGIVKAGRGEVYRGPGIPFLRT